MVVGMNNNASEFWVEDIWYDSWKTVLDRKYTDNKFCLCVQGLLVAIFYCFLNGEVSIVKVLWYYKY